MGRGSVLTPSLNQIPKSMLILCYLLLWYLIERGGDAEQQQQLPREREEDMALQAIRGRNDLSVQMGKEVSWPTEQMLNEPIKLTLIFLSLRACLWFVLGCVLYV